MSSERRRVIVVDDERPARAHVVRLLNDDPRFQLAGEAATGAQALELIETAAPDLVVLDVQLPEVDGFEVLDAIGDERTFAVVFSTAHDEHALRAFDAHAVDYLLKPYDGERFARALDKAWAQLAIGTPDAGVATLARAQRSRRARLVVRSVEGWIRPSFDEITRITAAGKHAWIQTRAGRYLVREGLRRLSDRLDAARFVRVHRSEIVNLDAVERIESWLHGDAILVLRDGTTVVLSRTFRRAFIERFRR